MCHAIPPGLLHCEMFYYFAGKILMLFTLGNGRGKPLPINEKYKTLAVSHKGQRGTYCGKYVMSPRVVLGSVSFFAGGALLVDSIAELS